MPGPCIAILSLTSQLDDGVVGLLHVAAVAAVVGLVAVDQLLLGEGQQRPVLHGQHALDVASHAERPARSALA